MIEEFLWGCLSCPEDFFHRPVIGTFPVRSKEADICVTPFGCSQPPDAIRFSVVSEMS